MGNVELQILRCLVLSGVNCGGFCREHVFPANFKIDYVVHHQFRLPVTLTREDDVHVDHRVLTRGFCSLYQDTVGTQTRPEERLHILVNYEPILAHVTGHPEVTLRVDLVEGQDYARDLVVEGDLAWVEGEVHSGYVLAIVAGYEDYFVGTVRKYALEFTEICKLGLYGLKILNDNEH